MNGKTLGMLMMAVVCGLGAMYGTTRLISRGPVKVEEETQDVVVAVRDLKIEELIKPALVKTVRMAKSAVPPGAFSSVQDVEDRWLTIGLLENEPVVDKKLAMKGSPPGLVSRIPAGMRAFAVEVNEQTGVSGFVLPDHRVDVVQVEPGKNGQTEADTVLQDVLVLASGQLLTRSDDKSIQARTVTLAVTPEQVDTLVSAKARGALTLSLRGINDHEKVASRKKPAPEPVAPPPPPPVVVETVAAVKPEPPAPEPPAPAPPPPPARYVTIYRGLDNQRRIRLDHPIDPDEAATKDATTPPPSPASGGG